MDDGIAHFFDLGGGSNRVDFAADDALDDGIVGPGGTLTILDRNRLDTVLSGDPFDDFASVIDDGLAIFLANTGRNAGKEGLDVYRDPTSTVATELADAIEAAINGQPFSQDPSVSLLNHVKQIFVVGLQLGFDHGTSDFSGGGPVVLSDAVTRVNAILSRNMTSFHVVREVLLAGSQDLGVRSPYQSLYAQRPGASHSAIDSLFRIAFQGPEGSVGNGAGFQLDVNDGRLGRLRQVVWNRLASGGSMGQALEDILNSQEFVDFANPGGTIHP